VSYTVNWGERTRTNAPSSALSLVFSLRTLQGETLVSDTRNRNAAAAGYTDTYTTAQTVQPGTYTATFTFYADANGAGSVVGTATQTLSVPQSGLLPNLATTGTIDSVFIEAGQTVQVGSTVDLTFGALTAQGALLVLTPGSARWQVTQGGNFLTVARNGSAVTGVAPGTATVQVSVDGKTATEQVAVTGNPVTVSVDTNGRTLLLAAFQDGDDIWVPATITGDVVTAQVSSPTGRYGIAFVENSAQAGLQVSVIQATTSEFTSVTLPMPSTEPPTGLLSGTVSNLGANRFLVLSGFGTSDSIGANGVFSVNLGVRSPWDLLIQGQDNLGTTDGFFVSRGRSALPNTGLVVDAAAFSAPSSFGLTLTGGSDLTSQLSAELWTTNGTEASLAFLPGTSGSYPALPTALRVGTDRYTLSGFDFADTTSEQVSRVQTTPTTLSLALSPIAMGPMVGSEGIGTGTQGTLTYTLPTGTKVLEAGFYGAAGEYRVMLTSGYTGSSVNYTTPLFDTVAGWNATWNLGPFDSWFTRLYTNNGTVADLFGESAIRRDGYAWHQWDWYSPTNNTRQDRRKRPASRLAGAPTLPRRK
jgi:hypothetical protein